MGKAGGDDQENGKPLSRIVITSGDPDFYFGLEPLVKPSRRRRWSPRRRSSNILQPPKRPNWRTGARNERRRADAGVCPQALEANSFTIDGEKVTIMQPHDYAAFVWIRANKTISAAPAWRGMHLWTADTRRRPVVSNGVIRWTR